MQMVSWRGWELSRLMLGTVQFGLPYGVANRSGQPDLPAVRRILETAVTAGVNCLDTAAAYGTSEAVLGQVLVDMRLRDRVVVVTKIEPLSENVIAVAGSPYRAICNSVERSRKRLQIDCLPIVLFHHEPDAQFLDVVSSLRDRGWIKHVGVSCDNLPEGARKLVVDPRVDALQIPVNIVDQRHVDAGVSQAAHAGGRAVFARSAFLQGLLLMPEQHIPHSLESVIAARRILERVAGETGYSCAELCLRYLLAFPEITCVLTGIETETQIQENVRIFAEGPLEADLIADIESRLPELSEEVLTPRLWSLSKKS